MNILARYLGTGSLQADRIDVFAQREEDGSDVIVAVATGQPGVLRDDDWDGFGQTTTGSGTTLFRDLGPGRKQSFYRRAVRTNETLARRVGSVKPGFSSRSRVIVDRRSMIESWAHGNCRARRPLPPRMNRSNDIRAAAKRHFG
ncbi:alkylation response protein AidB-like acyl-CoA dehydrogenase [Paraburkholderia silvatlantica]|uniref:Alkylation response protein AidB-like acyl-CoA dehydrogenase n=1 Tax=Paraburkholderia silvatlantica TaxID=321895 RepID=A0ABR6FVP5_9BURK|nr:alkylation response protein AidB-like acyl-CoA dehydrogenase [Paraburkholderia silvatlantica]PVY27817.1 hypothetical protein C7411_11810 [Paraburkholderia silvatlantica]PXW34664.1 hypothetical protein C7413_11710 [Paraburkholderia silvatlantica]